MKHIYIIAAILFVLLAGFFLAEDLHALCTLSGLIGGTFIAVFEARVKTDLIRTMKAGQK